MGGVGVSWFRGYPLCIHLKYVDFFIWLFEGVYLLELWQLLSHGIIPIIGKTIGTSWELYKYLLLIFHAPSTSLCILVFLLWSLIIFLK